MCTLVRTTFQIQVSFSFFLVLVDGLRNLLFQIGLILVVCVNCCHAMFNVDGFILVRNKFLYFPFSFLYFELSITWLLLFESWIYAFFILFGEFPYCSWMIFWSGKLFLVYGLRILLLSICFSLCLFKTSVSWFMSLHPMCLLSFATAVVLWKIWIYFFKLGKNKKE